MSPEETIAFPNPNRYTDTPESIEECLLLVGHIDTLLAMWRYSTHHPTASPMRIAELIHTDCQPPEEPAVDYMGQTGFGGTYTREHAQYLADRDSARRALIEPLGDPALDELEIEDGIVARYIGIVQTLSNNPRAPEIYKEAVVKLRRIIILREQLTQESGIPKRRATETNNYIEMINKLATALM